ncbi:MAG: hypothetical protein ACNA71_00685 [Kiritimatiellia bacterium]
MCNHTRLGHTGSGISAGRLLLAAFTAGGVLALYGLALWWGALNQDEGWYLYAARMVSEGLLPYRDFAYTQGPVMAYVYAAAYPLVHMGGVLGGRLFTAFLGLLSLLLAVHLAGRLARRRGQDPFWPMLLVLAFCGLNLYHVYFTTVVKTYALAAVLMLGGMILLDRALVEAQAGLRARLVAGQAALGGLFLALAAGTRLSAAFLLPACWLPMIVCWLRGGRPRPLGYWLIGLLTGGAAGIAMVFVPFYLVAQEQLVFGLLQYHAGRTVAPGLLWFAYKIGFGLRLVQAYWPLLAAAVLVVLLHASRRQSGAGPRLMPWRLPLWSCVAAVTAIHLLSVFPYDDYQVFVMPLAVIAISLPFGHLLDSWCVDDRWRVRLAGGLCAALFLCSVSGGLLQGWLLEPRDRIWWPVRTESALGQLRRIGSTLRAGNTRRQISAIILTQDTYLAVEAGFRVPPGMEMGPFSNFLDLPDEDAVRYRVLNRTGLVDVLATSDAAWAAYSDYGFAIVAPTIVAIAPAERDQYLDLLRGRFVLVDTFGAFGQAQTDLHLYRRKLP